MADKISQKLTLEVETNTTKAKLGLDNLKKGVDGVAGAATKSGKELAENTGALSKMNNMSTKSVFAITNLAQTFQLASGPAHQARFVFGQLMDQFALMGPKGLLIGGAVAGLGVLYKKFTGGAKDAEEAALDFSGSLRGIERALKDDLGAGFASATELLAEFTNELRFHGLTARQIKVQMAEDTLLARESQIETLRANLDMVKAVAAQDQENIKILQDEMEATKKAEMGNRTRVETLNDLSRQLLKAQSSARASAGELALVEAGLKGTTEKAEAAKTAFQKLTAALIELEEKDAKAKAGARAGPRAAAADDEMPEGDYDRNKAIDDLEDAKTSAAEKGANDRKKIAKKEWDYKASLMQASTSLASSLLAESIKISLSGEKNMGEALLKMFLERTGQSLIAMGTRAVFEGAVMNSTLPGSGVAAMATGAAAIAAGAAMSAGGAAISLGGVTGGGSSGSASTSEGTGSVGGISTGGFGGSSGQQGTGTTIINISYGVGGPEPESAAQAVLDAIAIGRRRGLEGRA